MIDAIDTPAAADTTAHRLARIVRDFRDALTAREISGYAAWHDAKVKLIAYVSGNAADEILAEVLADMIRYCVVCDRYIGDGHTHD